MQPSAESQQTQKSQKEERGETKAVKHQYGWGGKQRGGKREREGERGSKAFCGRDAHMASHPFFSAESGGPQANPLLRIVKLYGVSISLFEVFPSGKPDVKL